MSCAIRHEWDADADAAYRHFVKEELPRIRWANPLLDVAVHKVPKTREDTWAPQATVEFRESESFFSVIRYQLRFLFSPFSRWRCT